MLETEPWQELNTDLGLRSDLMGNDPARHDRARDAFELRAIQGDLFAQTMLDSYWTLSDEPDKYERGTQWSLIVLSCVSGADVLQRGSLSRESVLSSMAGLTVWATREQLIKGIDLAREWFRENSDSAGLSSCRPDEIDLYEQSIRDFLE